MADLYQLVTTANSSGSGKRMVGYSVGAYAGVLSALQKAGQMTVQYTDGVLGTSRIDWDSASTATYDNSGFSSNINSGLWKMALQYHGSIPIEFLGYGNAAFELQCLPNDSQDKAIARDGEKRWCPYVLSEEGFGACTSDEFAVGAFLDLKTLGVSYFNKFYSNPSCSFDEQKVIDMVANGYLMAQITFPELKKFKLVKVLGQAPIGGSAAISLDLALLATREWKDIKTVVNVIENSKDKKGLIPASNEYKVAIDGKSYKSDRGSIDGYTKQQFKGQWMANSTEKNSEINVQIAIDPIPMTDCLVRLYVPVKFKPQIVEMFGGNSPPEFLFQESFEMEYVEAQAEQFNGAACTNPNVAKMLECIQIVADKRGCRRFPQSSMGKRGAYGPTKWLNHDLLISNAMAGKFVLPSGWPMCTINNDFNRRKGGGWPQSKKGHPGGGNAEWVYCCASGNGSDAAAGRASIGGRIDSKLRLDSELKTKLSSKILQGDMPPEWYQKRLEKAYAGVVVIHCNSEVQTNMQNWVNQTWNYYYEAAQLYNSTKPDGEKITTGELMLRCVPSLCSCHGASSFHRNRKEFKQKRSSGHDAGAGIDLAYYNNLNTASTEKNKRTDLGAKCDGAYRPMLHALYANGGGWGGEYRFMGTQYDAMHIQFNR